MRHRESTLMAKNDPIWRFAYFSNGLVKNHQLDRESTTTQFWLVVSTHLKNISQKGNLPQIGVKIKNVWNHQPAVIYIPGFLSTEKSLDIKTSPNLCRAFQLLPQVPALAFHRRHWVLLCCLPWWKKTKVWQKCANSGCKNHGKISMGFLKNLFFLKGRQQKKWYLKLKLESFRNTKLCLVGSHHIVHNLDADPI